MLNKLQGSNIFAVISTISIISVILLAIPFLLEDSIKYSLYIFAISLTLILIVLLRKSDYNFKFRIPYLKKIIDYFFIISSVIVFVSNLDSHLVYEPVFYFSILITFFLPGWIFLRILGIDDINKKPAGIFILSFACSLGLTAPIFFLSTILQGESILILSGIFLVASLLPLLKDSIRKLNKEGQTDFSLNFYKISVFDILILVWILVFFIFIISNLYPLMNDNPFLDIFRHSLNSEQIVFDPNLLKTNYPWYYFNLGSVNELSTLPTSFLQSGGAYLSILVIFSFYVMSKSYLTDINKKAHHIATIFFFIFSGLGWLFLIQQNLSMLGESNYLDILRSVNQVTYWDTLYGQGPWLWFWLRPVTLGFTIFFALLYILKQESLNSRNYVIVASLLLLSLTQIHFPEFVIFVVLIFLLGIFFPKLKLRLQETSISIIIASGLALLLNISYRNFFTEEFSRISNTPLFVIILLSVIIFLLVRFEKRPKVTFHINPKIIALIILSIYFGLFFYWFSNAEDIPIDNYKQILGVPWEFYPVLLGVVGVIAIPGTILVFSKYRNYPVVLFAVLLGFSFILGRTVTLLNAEFFDAGYWERRIIPIVFVGASILAALFVSNLWNYFSKSKSFATPKNMGIVALLTSIVLVGIFSTFVDIESYRILLPEIVMSNDEQKLKGVLNEANPNSFVLTYSDRSLSITGGSTNKIPDWYRSQLWPAHSPELTLEALTFFGNPSILYLNNYDLNYISKSKKGHIASHLLPISPLIYEGSEGKVYQLEIDSHPTPSSDLVLIISTNQENFYYLYDILSLGNYNYTTAFLSDVNTLRKAKIIVAPDEYSANQIIEYKQKYSLPFQKLIVLNIGEYGSLVNFDNIEPKSIPIIDDNASDEWSSKGIGKGIIDVPSLEDNPHLKTSGNNSLLINITNGTYGLWQITKEFNEPLNLTNFDYAKFDWYGKGDNKKYVVQFTKNPGKYFWYNFEDSWEGWKTVRLPLHVRDGSVNVDGVIVNKATHPDASWEKIKKVEIKPVASNKGQVEKFYIDDFFFEEKFKVSKIKSTYDQKEIQFSTQLELGAFLDNKNYNTIASYEGGGPFILSKTFEDFEMFYFNLMPIINGFNSPLFEDRSDFYKLGSLLDMIDVKLPAYHPIKKSQHSLTAQSLMAFKNATLTGNTQIFSSSAIMFLNNSKVGVNVDGNNIEFDMVNRIIPINVEKLILNSQEVVINDGNGFYSRVFFNSTGVKFLGESSAITIYLRNGSETTINGNEIQFNLTDSYMFIRQPTIITDGLTSFVDFFTYNDLNEELRVINEDVQFLGNLTFKTKFSDEFTTAINPSFKGKILRSDSNYSYGELSYLKNIFISWFSPN